jgi:hypothetical protein
VAHNGTRAVTRPLRDDERALIEVLLTTGDGADRYREQLSRLAVVGVCECGCPSVDFSPGTDCDEDPATSTIVARADARSPEGVPVGIILWARRGTLIGLEVHPWDATTSFGLPRPDTVHNLEG